MNRQEIDEALRSNARVQWIDRHGKTRTGYIASVWDGITASVYRDGRAVSDYVALSDLRVVPNIEKGIVKTDYQPTQNESILLKVLWHNKCYEFPVSVLESIAKEEYGADSLIETQKILKKFVRLGFVDKRQDGEDMRRNIFRLSGAGEIAAHRVCYPEQYVNLVKPE